MILKSLTEMVQRKFTGSDMWVEQEGEDVFLRHNQETIAEFKGGDEWGFEDLLRAAERYLRGVPDGVTFESVE